MKYKKGDVLMNGYGDERKVLDSIGELFFLSEANNFDMCSYVWTLQQIENACYNLKKEKTPKDWEPEDGEGFFMVTPGLQVLELKKSYPEFNTEFYNRKYKTREEAEEVVEKIKQFMGSL